MIEDSSDVYSVRSLARELDVTPERVESMLEYWIRKGKIRPAAVQNCGSCSVIGNCSFVVEMPKSYELVLNNRNQNINAEQVVCE